MSTAVVARNPAAGTPTLEREEECFRHGSDVVAGVDEVGRGALAGPVSVGIVAIRSARGPFLSGLGDSKALSRQRREELMDPILRWAAGGAVGHASAEEIDMQGLAHALRVAAARALLCLAAQGVRPSALIVDGSYNWLQPPRDDAAFQASGPARLVLTQVKADSHCCTVAAASILAKVTRDAHMRHLDRQCPQYGWAANKGYGTSAHRQAIGFYGPSYWHRRSWNLPTREPTGNEAS